MTNPGFMQATTRTAISGRSSGRTSRRWIQLAVCCFIFVFASRSNAQQARTLRGGVVDSTGLAIQGAAIEFQTKAETYLATTDDQGAFSIPEVADGGTLL